jgi:hypothetical protein
MKDNSVAPSISRVGEFTESKFGIASGEDLVYIFDILRNKLYSDKIMAVVREYSTNAADANVEAGVSEPIVITSPSSMSPHFKVRDFGGGLSEDDVRNVYCMYGRSTKRNSNDFTGQLGLGSKSGFSYGDSFTITSFHNGLKTVYSAYIDETKLGSIAKLMETPTSERNGIEITIPVKKNDISVFKSRIATAIKHFKIKPQVIGSIDEDRIEVLFSGNGWSIMKPQGSYSYQPSAVAIMGNIGYRIDPAQVYPDHSSNYWSVKDKGLKFILGSTSLEFGIGELSIAASREDLEYNSVTIKAIKSKAEKAFNEYVNSLQHEIDKCKNGFEVRIFCHKVDLACNNGYWADVSGNLTWKGKKVPSRVIPLCPGMNIDAYMSTDGLKSKRTTLTTITITHDLSKPDLMYYCDDPAKSTIKAQYLAKSNPGKNVFLFKTKSYVNTEGEAINGEDWFDMYDFPKSLLNNISSVTVPATQRAKPVNRVTRDKGLLGVYKMVEKPKCWGTQSENWTDELVAKKDIKFFLPILRFKVVIDGREIWPDSVLQMIRSAKCYLGVIPDYHAVKTSDLEKIPAATNLIEEIKHQLLNNKAFLSDHKGRQNKHYILNKLNSGLSFVERFRSHPEIIKTITDSSMPFSKLFELARSIETSNKKENYDNIINLVSFTSSEDRTDIDKMIEDFKNTYPMLNHVSSHGSPAQFVKDVLDYVKLVETK